ncbi:MAG: malate synthase A [Microbacteriaceae bacterium]|nr:malate synthase A [Microbacteriaceae bacterium]
MNTPTATLSPARIDVLGGEEARFDEILTPEALDFLTELHDIFEPRRRDRLEGNRAQRHAIERGQDPDFKPETAAIRADRTWRVAGAGPGLVDRRVEITGPTDRKMAINALNSGANVWLADHEDATSPTWHNVIAGQVNLHDAIRGRLSFTSPDGKEYRVQDGPTPTIVFRPRGLHLTERHLRWIDAEGSPAAASASLVDAGLYAFHNARALVDAGRGPYFYLPKMESRLDARWWDDVFSWMERRLGLDHGTIRATVLIETLPAAFEMEEILYELREHCAGLNAGRWDYVFSIIKHFRTRGRQWLLPDRGSVTMTVPFMRAYTDLLVQTCHARGAYAMGGMSAFIPNKADQEATSRALERIADDKRREAHAGFDGTWVAHPGLIETARTEFDTVLQGRPHQLDRQRDDVSVTAADLLDFTIDGGRVTAHGIQQNVSVALRYLDAWLRGTGAAAIDGLMEDAATAEISRSQLWHWIHQGALADDRMPVTRERVEWVIDAELAALPRSADDRLDDAAELLRACALGEDFPPFLTVPAYARYLCDDGR